MRKKESINSILKSLKILYTKLFVINDTPQKIAQGLGIGVFTGIIPGIGPVAALFLALFFRANRASALLGSLLTNTWLSFLTFFLSVRIGSAILKTNWQDVYNDWLLFLKDFHWSNLIQLSIFKIILPVIIGYLVVASCLGIFAYIVTLLIVNRIKQKRQIFNK